MKAETKTEILARLDKAVEIVQRPRERVRAELRVARDLVLAEPTDAPVRDWTSPWRSDSLWRTPIPEDAALDAKSGLLIANFIADGGTANPSLSYTSFGAPVVLAGNRGFTVRSSTGWGWNLHDAGPVPIPDGVMLPAGTDKHLCVYDPAQGRAWDLWHTAYDGTWWSAGAGSTYTTDTDGITPERNAAGTKLAGATSANFPLLGGLIRPEDFEGEIEHALVFAPANAYAVRGYYHVPPATHHGGNQTPNYDKITEGHRLQLDPAFDVGSASCPEWNKKVLRALQRYGMFFRDGAGKAFSLFAENVANRSTPGYPPEILATAYPPLYIPFGRLRVLAH